MHVTFRNVSEKHQNMYMDAIKFVVRKFIPRQEDNLDIEVRIVHNLTDTHGNMAHCDFLDCNERPRMYDIEICHKLDEYEKLESLFHELIHLKQMAKGELFYYLRYNKNGKRVCPDDMVRWKGKPFKMKKDMDYYDFPWEIEAFGREKGLMKRFLEKNKKYKRLVDVS